MAEITLDTLRKQRGQAADVPAEETPDTLKEQITLLTPDERRKVEELKEQIDLTDSQMLMQYGAGAKQNIADFSENILDNVRAKDTGYVGELMTGLIANVEGLDFDSLEKEGGIMGIFKKAESKVKKFLMQYEKLEVQVDRIEGKLEEARMEMLKDIGMLDAMYEKNLSYFRQLQLYIAAGEEKLQELREQTLPSLRAEAERSGDPMNAQIVRDFEDTVNQFEKKIHDLKTSRTIAIQTAPQLRLVQNNDKLLADKIQTAIQETIPLWKSQMVMALGLYRQQARESERSIVDIATLRKANENLISTMSEAVRIQQEGRRKRQEAEAELEKLEHDIRASLLGHPGADVR